MDQTLVNKSDEENFIEKSCECYHKTKEETLKNRIVQEVLKSYTPGGCNYKGGIKK